MSQREEHLIRTVERMMAEYELWPGDKAIEQESAFADAVEICIAACGRGDIPENCRELVTAVGRVAVEWGKYWAGHFAPGSAVPLESFTAPFNDVAHAINGVRPPEEQVLEDIAECIELGYTLRNIAKMYGKRLPSGVWVGPFWTDNVLRADLVKAEAKVKGSVLGENWKHPNTDDREAEFAEQNRNRLKRLDQAASSQQDLKNRRQYKPTEEEIIAYADEGAFLNQFPKQWPSVTIAEVSEILERNAVTPASKEDPRSPSKRAEDERAEAASLKDSLVEQTDSEDVGKIDARIVELHKLNTTPADIREQLSKEFSREISPQKVGAVIRSAEAKA